MHNAMKINRAPFVIGLSVYVASFFLTGVMGPGSDGGPISGYSCAWSALVLPWQGTDFWSKGIMPILMPATLIVGLINPLFIATVIFLLKHFQRSFAVLRITLLCMFPFCSVPFVVGGFRPSIGFTLWIFGMLLVLFSRRSDESLTPLSLFKPTLSG
jgi:hypothetical protein